MTIAITGASGQLGRLTIAHLKTLTAAGNIVALARDPAKVADLGVAARAFDYTKPTALAAALGGVRVLVLISSSDFNDRVGQHRAVVQAAVAAGVERIVYTSIMRADTSPLLIAADHRATEQLIAQSGLRATIMRNGWYTENWTGTLAGAIAAGGMIGAAGTAGFTPATRADYAHALAIVAADDSFAGQALELGGDETITLADIAAAVSHHIGKDLPYTDLPATTYQEILQSFGLPAGFAAMLVDVDQRAGEGWLADTSGTLTRILGRPTVPLAAAVAAAV